VLCVGEFVVGLGKCDFAVCGRVWLGFVGLNFVVCGRVCCGFGEL